MQKPSYYSIMPASVRYDSRLKPNEKLLFGEITALTNYSGKCFAKNRYFAELYNVKNNTVSGWVQSLKRLGYISIEYTYKENTLEIDKRLITVNFQAQNPETLPVQELENKEENSEEETEETPHRENTPPPSKKEGTPSHKNRESNTTRVNNTRSKKNKKNKKQKNKKKLTLTAEQKAGLYAEYPKKRGKAAGIEYLEGLEFKTEKEKESFYSRALAGVVKFRKENADRDNKYLPHFSTFMHPKTGQIWDFIQTPEEVEAERKYKEKKDRIQYEKWEREERQKEKMQELTNSQHAKEARALFQNPNKQEKHFLTEEEMTF